MHRRPARGAAQEHNHASEESNEDAASLTLIAGVLALAACTNPDGTFNNQRTGTVIGGVSGAAIGNELDGNIGAPVGAIVGGAIGNQAGERIDANQQGF